MLDEERRLFYVAATRARRHLLVTAVAAGDAEEQPSRFLTELAEEVAAEGAGVVAGSAAEGAGVVAGSAAEGAGGGAGSAAEGAGGGTAGAGAGALAPTAAPPRALTLPAVVAELRAAVADPAAAPDRRRAAATQLARLARAGVRGAHPDDWWGLPQLSDERPLADPGQPVTVSPSTIESVRRCSLRWLLERHGGGTPPAPPPR